MSQLALATDAEVSARHVCFLETGRATPSRDMVELLASVLRVPLADRNVMLVAAGYAPAYAERALEATAVQHVRRAFAFILRQQEPYPAFVIDAQWNIIMRNDAADRIFGLFRTAPGLPLRLAGNALHALCHPDGLRRFIVNWEEFAGPLIQTLRREAAESANPAAGRLRDEVLAYPGMPSQWTSPGLHLPLSPVLTLRLKRDDIALAFFSMLTVLAAPRDIMLERLRVECFYPADAATADAARKLAAVNIGDPRRRHSGPRG
jgi:transcriptional regulator with XRE-family HTH domain